MQKTLPIIFFLILTGFVSEGQCVIKSSIVQLNTSIPSGAGCLINFDYQFTIENNGGNKYIYLHSWLSGEYPNYFNCPGISNDAKAPIAADLLLSRINIGIHNDIHEGHPKPSLMNTYVPDPTVPITPAGALFRYVYPTGDSARFTIKGIQVFIPFGCNSLVGLMSDFWSTQAESASTIHCVSCSIPVLLDPKVFGLVNCTSPRTFNLIISSVKSTPLTGNYQVFIDNPAIGELNGVTGTFGPEDSLAASGNYTTIIEEQLNRFVATNQAYEPYSSMKPSSDRNLWVSVQTQGYSNRVMGYLLNSCAPLPVKQIIINGHCHDGTIRLFWRDPLLDGITFYELQRQKPGEAFITVADSKRFNAHTFIKTDDGMVTFTDNTPMNVPFVNYRIQTNSFDNKTITYSPVISIRLHPLGNWIIYPNPSVGSFRVQFPEGFKGGDFDLIDINGRSIRCWKAFVSSELYVTGLLPGIYYLRSVKTNSKEMNTHTIIIQ